MDIENLKARYYMLLGQAEEAKNIYTRATQEFNDQKKKEEETIKNASTAQQPEPATTPGPEAVNP